MTITWHVDDLKVSHKNPWRINEVVEKLMQIYGNIKIKRGKIHNYLVICLDYLKKLKISVKDYKDKIINELPEVIKRTASTPAVDYLFQIKDKTEASKLDKERAITFHHMVAQLFFLIGQGTLDFQTAIAFLITCVKIQMKTIEESSRCY